MHLSLHERALEASRRYKQAEADLIGLLIEIDQKKIFRGLGYASLFEYVCRALGLSESVSYNLITVSRKCSAVPELKLELERGLITLTNARKIAPVLTSKNQSEWLEQARTLSSRKLEREVARVSPTHAVPERATYVAADRLRLELGLNEAVMKKLRRIQDLESSRQRKIVSLEEAIERASEVYLEKRDPLRRAVRQKMRGKLPLPLGGAAAADALTGAPDAKPAAIQADRSDHACPPNVEAALARGSKPAAIQADSPAKPQGTKLRTPIPANIKNLVLLRDESRCTYKNREGIRCLQKRYLDFHHIRPVSHGGRHEQSNITLLCRAHHTSLHNDYSEPSLPS